MENNMKNALQIEYFFQLLQEDENNQEIADTLARIMNTSSEMESLFVEKVKKLSADKQQVFVALVLHWLSKLSFQLEDGNYDGRNESSVRLGTKLYSIPEVQEMEKSYPVSQVVKAAMHTFSYDHKTIQSCFSSCTWKMILFLMKEQNSAFEKMRQIII